MSFWREGGAYQGWNIGGLEQPNHKKWLFVSPCAIARGIRWDPHPQPIRVSRLFINHTLQSFLRHFGPSMLPDTTRDGAELKSNSAVIRRIHLQHVPRWSKPKALVEDSTRPFLQEALMSNGLGAQGLSQRWVIMKDDIWDYKSTSLATTSETICNYKSNILHDGIHQGPDLHSAVTQCWRDPARDCQLSQHT